MAQAYLDAAALWRQAQLATADRVTARMSELAAGLPPDIAWTIGKDKPFFVGQRSLKVLAEQTGGYAAVESNDYAEAFDRAKSGHKMLLVNFVPAQGQDQQQQLEAAQEQIKSL